MQFTIVAIVVIATATPFVLEAKLFSGGAARTQNPRSFSIYAIRTLEKFVSHKM